MKQQSSAITSRGLAITCLSQWAGTGKPIQGFIDTIVHSASLKPEDRQLAHRLVMGVLRRQQYLDTILARFSKTPLRKMKPLTLAAMRVGIYQLCFLERVPESAAVNETVKALKKFHQPGWLLKFVNGTLRAIARAGKTLPEPESAGSDNGPILEHPDWLTERWISTFGRDRMENICRINTLEPQICLQVNTSRISRDQLLEHLYHAGIKARPGQYAPDSLILPDYRGAVTVLPGFGEGFFQVQDQAARLCCALPAPLQENSRHLDGCAGLGSKTCALAATLPPGGSLHAVEPDLRRVRLLKENISRQQLNDRITVTQQDLQTYAGSSPPPFDSILIDAPCSGTGVIRRHPDIRWNRQPEDIAALQATQFDLLHTAAEMLTPSGILVYATCSLEPEENHQVISGFLKSHAEFSLTNCKPFLPAIAGAFVDDNGCFAPMPAEEIEGFFAARLVKNSDE